MPGTFNVDHREMPVGISSPGYDMLGDIKVVTLDVRCVVPYEEKVLTNKELHTVEHILATEIANACAEYSEKFPGQLMHKLYWGPMGCQTGYYLLVAVPGNMENIPFKVCEMLQDACRKVLLNPFYKTPANTKKECGHYHTLYGTAKEVNWILRRIYDACEVVMANGEFFQYKLL